LASDVAVLAEPHASRDQPHDDACTSYPKRWKINALDPDSDNDGLFDETELGKDCSNPATDAAAETCIGDVDAGMTKTSPLDPDTDDGGVIAVRQLIDSYVTTTRSGIDMAYGPYGAQYFQPRERLLS
jgi:hypothetical protein